MRAITDLSALLLLLFFLSACTALKTRASVVLSTDLGLEHRALVLAFGGGEKLQDMNYIILVGKIRV